MHDDHHDDGVIIALVERFEKHRLPRALALKEKVDAGNKLDAMDLAFLDRVFETAPEVQRLVEKHPEYQGVVARVTHLYHEITAKALENETKKGNN